MIVLSETLPINAWKSIIREGVLGMPLYVKTDLNNLDVSSELFQRYYKTYKWHFEDSYRSLLTKMIRKLTPYEFSYYDRIHNYFGQDQIDIVLNNFNNIICNWDSFKDYNNKPKPCFMTAKFIPEGNFLHLSVTFRTRDIIKRLYPNWIALKVLLDQVCKKSNKKPGKLFDYSNQIIYDKDKRDDILNWKEFDNEIVEI